MLPLHCYTKRTMQNEERKERKCGNVQSGGRLESVHQGGLRG
jgi:hypothetical protein